MGLQTGDGLQDTVMAFLGEISLAAGLPSMRTDEFGEINLRRTALAAIGAAQAGPDFTTAYKLSIRIQHGPFDNLAR
jgi:hypothetical protein